MPTRYVSSSSGYIRSLYTGKAALQSSRGDSKAMTASRVSWTTPDTAHYMYGNPVLMELGGVTRLLTLGAKQGTLYSAQDKQQTVVGDWGACLLCRQDMFRNVESAAVAGEHTCETLRHTVCGYDGSEQDTNPAAMLTLGTAGGPVIAAWDITEDTLKGPDAHNRIFTDSETGAHGEGVERQALRPLLALAAMATASEGEGLPCKYNLTDAESFETAHGEGFLLASAVPPGGGDPRLLADCSSWKRLEPPGEAPSGAAMFKLMSPTWAVMDGSIRGVKRIAGLHIVFDTLRSGVDNVIAMAAVLLHEGVASELAVTDAVLTPYGGLINIVLTFIAVLATYASRKDLMHVLGKAAPPRAARAAAAALSFFAIVTPAALLVVTQVGAAGSNPDGGDSTKAWVRADALGQGAYRVVALVSMSFTAPSDAASEAFMYVNLALAALGALVVCAATLRGPKTGDKAAAGQPATRTRRWPSLAASSHNVWVREVEGPSRRFSSALFSLPAAAERGVQAAPASPCATSGDKVS
ncbi:hypothetical protein JKP88DRAFT_349652 [Tribonema minus]|uniref:Uncharacterized protein n=1 Tax=Tribonema minus TaxID=303371 RepID=A0A835YSE7_9STRA|nr:hypothetical protein JKP88DRAFT_349652 [Tribonema minus]